MVFPAMAIKVHVEAGLVGPLEDHMPVDDIVQFPVEKADDPFLFTALLKHGVRIGKGGNGFEFSEKASAVAEGFAGAVAVPEVVVNLAGDFGGDAGVGEIGNNALVNNLVGRLAGIGHKGQITGVLQLLLFGEDNGVENTRVGHDVEGHEAFGG